MYPLEELALKISNHCINSLFKAKRKTNITDATFSHKTLTFNKMATNSRSFSNIVTFKKLSLLALDPLSSLCLHKVTPRTL